MVLPKQPAETAALRLAKELWGLRSEVGMEAGQTSWEEAKPEDRTKVLKLVRSLVLAMKSTPKMTHNAANHIAGVTPGIAERVWSYMVDGLLQEVAEELPPPAWAGTDEHKAAGS